MKGAICSKIAFGRTGEVLKDPKVRAAYLNMDAPPAATLVQAGLSAGLLLEVEAVAMLPEN